jgi:hypothetical protein
MIISDLDPYMNNFDTCIEHPEICKQYADAILLKKSIEQVIEDGEINEENKEFLVQDILEIFNTSLNGGGDDGDRTS